MTAKKPFAASIFDGILLIIMAPSSVIAWPILMIGIMIYCLYMGSKSALAESRKGRYGWVMVALFVVPIWAAMLVGFVVIEGEWMRELAGWALPLVHHL